MFKKLLPLFFYFISILSFGQSFRSIWNTSNTSTNSSENNQITIPTNPAYNSYNYTVEWGDGSNDSNVTGDITHTYAGPGIYTVAITGDFPAIFFNNQNTSDRLKIIEITDWGTIQWQTMENAFYGCANLNFDAISPPDLSQVTSLKNMFRNGLSFNGIVNGWDVSTITDISGMFYNAEIFNRPVNDWTTNAITDMSQTFKEAELFDEPLDNWNTSAVINMSELFFDAEDFNQNIGNWNVTQVTDMSGMFHDTQFNFPLNNWRVDNVTNMSKMFREAGSFNQNINNWIVDNVTDMSEMFYVTPFDYPLDNWNVGNVQNMSQMFFGTRIFNKPLNNWNVSSVTNMSGMFGGGGGLKTAFNQPLDLWNVSNVTDMSRMFSTSSFNQPIDVWDVSGVTNMSNMFSGSIIFLSDFDQPLPSWEVDNVTSMSSMFQLSVFNQDIGMWKVDNVTNMSNMFNASLNFNQVLSGWNFGSVTNMSGMFQDTQAFNHNLGGWDITNVTNMANMLSNAALSEENYDNTLIGWAAQAVKMNVNLGATNLNYCDGLTARQSLIDSYNWNITNDIVNCTNVFCTTITSPAADDTQVPANSNIIWEATPNATGYRVTLSRENGGSTQIIYNNEDFGNVVGLDFTNEFIAGDTVSVTVIPYNDEGPAVGCTETSFTVVPSWVNSPDAYKITIDTRIDGFSTTPINQFEMEINSDFTYDYSIDWGDGQYNNNVSRDITHTYLNQGIYTVAVIGTFPAPYFGTFGDGEKVLSIEQWGTHEYLSMEKACNDCNNMVYNATDIPDLSQVESMLEMFEGATIFNANINDWDVSNVTNMQSLFSRASDFDQPLDNWVVDNVTNMASMFSSARSFNRPLTTFNTSNVTNMASMFRSATAFDQNLNGWDVSNVTNMFGMFGFTQAFNSPLDNWKVDNVTDMGTMFEQAVTFNQPIDIWVVDNVTNMTEMFNGNNSDMAFNQPLNSWNVDRVTDMKAMFQKCVFFDKPLNNWEVGLVTDMSEMFKDATAFNQNINSWNVTNIITTQSMFENANNFDSPLNLWDVNSVVDMSSMFEGADSFNQPINEWEVSAVANMTSMFRRAIAFDQQLNSWDVSSVTAMPSMFDTAEAFNGIIGTWDVASVTNMKSMFEGTIAFDQPLPNWDTGAVLSMEAMFKDASIFNQPIDSWDVSFVNSMESMFENAAKYNQTMDSWNVASVTTMEKMFKMANDFNDAIGRWNVRGVTTMEEMFNGASAFNQSINNWRVSGVSNMNSMFSGAAAYNQPMNLWNLGTVSMHSTFFNAIALDQNLGDWDISGVSNMTDMLDNTGLIRENYDNTLIAWSEQTLISGITLGAEGLPYCDAQEERQSMIDTFGWTFSLDVRDCPIPECIQLTSPLNRDIDVPVNTNITWDASLFAQGYRLTVGTSPGGNDIVDNLTITNETSYEFATDFNTGDIVYVTLIPFNDEGDAIGPCTEESFTISNAPATIPECTNLISPLNNDTDVLVTADLSWNPISNADGYKLSVGTSLGANDLVNNEDVGNFITYDFASNLPEDSDIFITITPYNDQGDALSCEEENFKTEFIPVPPVCTNLISPINNDTAASIDTNLSWETVDNATGYLVIVGTTSGGIEIVNNVDVGNATTYDIPEDLLENRLYYVTIIPYNAEGDATGCVEETFRTGDSNSPPACVILSTPTNNANQVALDTNLSWNGSTTATGYRLRVGTTTNGTDILNEDVGNVSTFNLVNDLPESTTIYVTIIAYNLNGDAINCSEEIFTTNGPTTCTSLISPANNASDIAINTNIEWNINSNADGYLLTVTGSSSTVNNLNNEDITSGNTYDFVNNFEPGETVTVTIIPYNNVGNAIGCTQESFTTETVPDCTTLSNPVNGAIDVPITTSLAWNSSAKASEYIISVGTTTGGIDVADNETVTTNEYNFSSDLEGDTVYFVTITPTNAIGNATGCTQESFTTETIPDCTTLSNPVNGAIDVPITTSLAWNPSDKASEYIISVGTTTGGIDVADNETVTTNEYNFSSDLEGDTVYFVTITPTNAIGNATGCTQESFTTETIPDYTTLSTPTNGAIDVPITTNLTWNSSAKASEYIISVGSTTGGIDVADNETVTTNEYNFSSDLEGDTVYFVTIIPTNNVGQAAGCIEESFTTQTIPNCTSLSLPLNGATNVIVTTNLTWNVSPKASAYLITIGTSPGENDVVDSETTTTNEYNFENNLEGDTEYFVTITPINITGNAISCSEEHFTTEPAPDCTTITSSLIELPLTNGQISWDAAPLATGYTVSISSTPGDNSIVNNNDVGNTTTYTITETLENNTTYYVLISPYSNVGVANACTEQSFTTTITDQTKYGLSPNNDGINDFWEIDNIEEYPNNEVLIYNRWGTLVFRTKNYDNTFNVFKGEANQLTNLGAGKLKSGTYFFEIKVDGEHNFNKTKGFLVLKR